MSIRNIFFIPLLLGICFQNLALAKQPKPQLVVYSQNSSKKLQGFIYKPVGKGPFPAVLWNHGSEKLPGWQPELGEFYTNHGFVFFIPHRHGQGRSDGEYILDEEDKIKAKETDPNIALKKIVELQDLANEDVEQAVTWLSKQTFVKPDKIIMSGCSYGGIQTLLSAESDVRVRGFIPFAPGAISWKQNPLLGLRLTKAVENAKAPIFLLQAENDFSTYPTDVLGPKLAKKGLPNKAKLYPKFGNSSANGHAAFAVSSEGAAVWEKDVLSFIKQVDK